MKDKANKGYWQRLAKIYAPLMESDKKFYNAICGYIRDYLKSDMNVLELACGTGQLSFPLSDCTNSWTATDFSENMIKQAKRRGTTEKLSFCVADATALSYENENFDCVVISNALHIMPEPEKAMQEIRRVLKKDGILYAPTFLWAEKKSSGLRKRLMSITGFKAYKEWNKENFCEFITDYGFTVVKVNLVDGGLAPVGVLIAKKQKYLFVGLVCVREEYQGQGYMRKALELAFAEGNRLGLPVVLDTDAKLKSDKYRHLGMELAGVRTCKNGSKLYELIKYPDSTV